MKILFIVFDAGWFGHTRTASVIIREMLKNGYEVSLLLDLMEKDSYLADSFREKCDVNYISTANLFVGLTKVLNQIKFDRIHVFEFKGLFEVINYCQKRGVPLVHTVCSNIPNYKYFPVANTVFLAEEFFEKKKRYLRYIKKSCVLPARILASDLEEQKKEIDGEDIRNKIFENNDLSDDVVLILRVCQISDKYYNGLLSVIAQVERCAREGVEVFFVHVGRAVGINGIKLMNLIEKVNHRVGKNVCMSEQNDYKNAFKYLALADIVIGSGRTAFEGMYYEKVVVVSDIAGGGCFDVVNEGTIDNIAHYNFSGRHFDVEKNKYSSLCSIIKEYRSGEIDKIKTIECNKQYFISNIDSRNVFKGYDGVYRNAVVQDISGLAFLIFKIKFYLLSVGQYIKGLYQKSALF